MGVCVGLALGPLITAIVTNWLDYDMTLYLFGAINGFGTLICLFLLPPELNISLTKEEEQQIDDEIEQMYQENKARERLKITWKTPIQSKAVCLTLLACFVGILNLNYWTGYLSTVFKDKYNMEENTFGYVVMS